MTTETPTPAPAAADSTLLEGLLQLALEGQTDAAMFQQIGEEVSSRLLETYGASAPRTA